MVSAHQLVTCLLEAGENIDWSPDPEAEPVRDIVPVGYIAQFTSRPDLPPRYLSRYPEWDGSYMTQSIYSARMWKRASTIERNWPQKPHGGFKVVPVYAKGRQQWINGRLRWRELYVKE